MRRIALVCLATVLLGSCLGHAQAVPVVPVARAANMLTVCVEACTVNAIRNADGTANITALLQYGAGTQWGAGFVNPTLPLYVNYTNVANLGGITGDRSGGAGGELDAQQAAAAYTVTATNGLQTWDVVIPALPPPPPPVCAPVPATGTHKLTLSSVREIAGSGVNDTFFLLEDVPPAMVLNAGNGTVKAQAWTGNEMVLTLDGVSYTCRYQPDYVAGVFSWSCTAP